MVSRYRYIILFIGIACATGCNAPTSRDVSSFRVSIIKRPTFAPATHFIIYPDSILISYTDFETRQMMSYIQRWADAEKKTIMNQVSQWDLDSFDAVAIGNQDVSDVTSFSFDVHVDSTTYQDVVYLKKIKELYQLTNMIDQWLPDQHKIGYNEVHFQ